MYIFREFLSVSASLFVRLGGSYILASMQLCFHSRLLQSAAAYAFAPFNPC